MDNSNINSNSKFGKGKIAEYLSSLTEEERKELARQAGIKSGEVRKRSANVKEAIETVFKLPVEEDDEIIEELERRGLQDTELYAATLKLIKQARNNPKAYETLVTMAGQKPSERMAVAVIDSQKSVNELREFFGVVIEERESQMLNESESEGDYNG